MPYRLNSTALHQCKQNVLTSGFLSIECVQIMKLFAVVLLLTFYFADEYTSGCKQICRVHRRIFLQYSFQNAQNFTKPFVCCNSQSLSDFYKTKVHNMKLITNQLGHVEQYPKMHHLVSSRHTSMSAIMYNSWTQHAPETYRI